MPGNDRFFCQRLRLSTLLTEEPPNSRIRETSLKNPAAVKTLPEAVKMIKEMNFTSAHQWAGDYNGATHESIANILKNRMRERIALELLAITSRKTRGYWGYGVDRSTLQKTAGVIERLRAE